MLLAREEKCSTMHSPFAGMHATAHGCLLPQAEHVIKANAEITVKPEIRRKNGILCAFPCLAFIAEIKIDAK